MAVQFPHTLPYSYCIVDKNTQHSPSVLQIIVPSPITHLPYLPYFLYTFADLRSYSEKL
jgi:hypothetical protein